MQFTVSVSSDGTQTEHVVTLSQPHCDRLTNGKCDPQQLIEAAFMFLLDREPKEKIMSQFDIPAIEQYFSEFNEQLPQYLAQTRGSTAGAHP